MTSTTADQARASRLVPMVAALLLVGAAGLRWPPALTGLGLLLVGFALVLPPRATAVLGVLAVLEALLVGLFHADSYNWVRVLNVLFAAVLAVTVSMLLEQRRNGLAASRLREDDILAAMPEAVIVLDADGVVRRANAGLTRLAPNATVGQHLHPLLGHVLADGTACAGGCALDGKLPIVEDYTPVEGERMTREGRTVPLAYTVGSYGVGQMVVTIRDVSVRIAAQQHRELLLQSGARSDEQTSLLRALGGPRLRMAPLDDIIVDSWVPDGQRGHSSSGLASLSSLPDGRRLLLMVNGDGNDDGDDDGDSGRYVAARDAWKVLYVARAHLMAGAPLAEMISRASDSLTDEADQSAASIVGAVIDPVTGYVQVASGGHPPPLLVRAEGDVTWLEAPGRPLGENLPRSVRLASDEMGPGDSLLVYGMGIVDGTRDVIEGMSALRSAAVALRTVPIEGVAQRIGRAAVPPGATREQADILMVLRLA